MTRKGKTLLLVVLAPIMLLPLALMGAFVAMIGVTVLLGAAGAMMGIFFNQGQVFVVDGDGHFLLVGQRAALLFCLGMGKAGGS